MDEKDKKKIERALLKKAIGYDAEEIVEEFGEDDAGEQRLCKRKVTKKNVPPDVSAAKLLLDLSKPCDYTSLTDEELEREREKLYKILEEIKK
ncbi:MAG: hypothetical protein J5903_01295 [Clostridia bacterium]|nr:hypothetical protein [Clostridia bacterium]